VPRPAIPAPVARTLRQEAGFGCCKCGFPIIQYHHIVEYSLDPHFRPEDMMVLCPTHHDQATQRALPEREQRALKAKPFNIVQNRARGSLAIAQDYCAVRVGSVELVGEGFTMSVDDEPLLRLDVSPDGYLAISATIFDHDDVLLATVAGNEWESGRSLPWDIIAGWQRVTLRQRTRDISLEVDARHYPVKVRARLHRHGVLIDLRDQVTVGGSAIDFGFRHLALVAFTVNVDTRARTATMVPDPDSHGGIVSWPDPDVRLERAVAFLKDLRSRV